MDARREVEVAQAESEATRDESLPEDVRGERRGRSVVQSVRLPAGQFAEIEQIAARAGVPVEALIRGWVLAGLAAEREPRCAMQSSTWPPTPNGCAAWQP
jgi:hypothetical protein